MMFKTTIMQILNETWPMILICCVILISLRLVYLYKNHQKLVLYKELLSLMFAIYVMCLFYVVTFQDVSWSTSNVTIFKEMFRYEFGSKLFFHNVVGNMIMFIPYGFFITYFLKIKKPYLVIALTTLVSLTIEITQLLIGRVFDIDDIILNILGGLFGYIVYVIMDKVNAHLPSWLKRPITYSIILVLMLLLGVLYLVG